MTPVAAASSVTPEIVTPNALRRFLLYCGVVSPLIYIGADVLAAMRWASYSYTSQTVSELMAIGAPTRPLIVAAFAAFGALSIAFGAGVCFASAGRRSLQITSVLFIIHHVAGLIGCVLFPIHMRGSKGTLSDTMHIIITAALVLLMLLYMAFGSMAAGAKFRWYSITTMGLLMLFRALAGMQGPNLASNLPTPWLGVEERINIYASLLWTVVFAFFLLREEKSGKMLAAIHASR